jgi:predicted transglutaminase-like cysteine proteinase
MNRAFTAFVVGACLAIASPALAKTETEYPVKFNLEFRDFIARYDAVPQRQLIIKGEMNEKMLERINDSVNSEYFFKDENVTYIGGGYWQTPEDTLELRNGDCEDYAVLKWHMLK